MMEEAQIANQIEGISHVIHGIADTCDDEGDRVYLGSTNDGHTLARQARRLLKMAATVQATTEALRAQLAAKDAEIAVLRAGLNLAANRLDLWHVTAIADGSEALRCKLAGWCEEARAALESSPQ